MKMSKLLALALVLLISVGTLAGSTIAWFTDEVTSTNNVIKSGTLELEVNVKNDKTAGWVTLSEEKVDKVFNYELWEPGYTTTRGVQVKNAGTLALKYQLNIIPNGEGELTKLAEVIDVYYTKDAWPTSRSDLGTRLGTLADIIAGTTKVEGHLTAGQADDVLYVSLKMQESADNEYQGLSIGDTFDLQVLALQDTVESDSFDNLYDANATTNNATVNVGNGDNLGDTLNDIKDVPGPVVIEVNGEVEWKTGASHGSTPFLDDEALVTSLTFRGVSENATFVATGDGVGPIGHDSIPVTFENLKIVDESVSYKEDSWEFGYLEFRGNLTFKNCEFVNAIQLSEKESGEQDNCKATFNNCSFNSNKDNEYAVWVCNGDATFNNCTFSGPRGIKICEAYGSDVVDVIIDNCTFDTLTMKPGVAIDVYDNYQTPIEETKGANITIQNSTFINCQPGDQTQYIYETDDVTPTLSNNTIINGEVLEIGTKNELVAFANDINGTASQYENAYVKLTSDIDLENMDWEPIGQTGATTFNGIFDGQNHTISNLNVDSSAEPGAHYSSGLFGWVESHSTGHGIIKNVKIDVATITGHHNCGALVGYITQQTALVENCHVTNATIKCTHENADACGDKAGALIGNATVATPVVNCTASGSTVSASRDAGQIVGAAKEANVTGCTAENVTVAVNNPLDCNDSGAGKNIREEVIGRLL